MYLDPFSFGISHEKAEYPVDDKSELQSEAKLRFSVLTPMHY